MRTLQAAVILLGSVASLSALANCLPTRCAAVQLTVARCQVAHIEASGEVVLGEPTTSKLLAPYSKGVLLFGRNRRERTIECYDGEGLIERQPKWAEKMNKDKFFVSTDRDLCQELLGRKVSGKTEFPCCDVPPPPDQPARGTCTVRERQLKIEPSDIAR